MKEQDYSRRAFLKKLAFSGAEAEESGNRSLVCIFLRGGADTLNMFIPFENDDYYRLRPNIAIKRNEGLKISDQYALHPCMAPILHLFMEGRMAVVQAVGTDNTSGSHFSCQDQIEHGESCRHSMAGGWLGRHLAGKANQKQSPLSAVAIGNSLPESLRSAPAVSVLKSIDDLNLKDQNNNNHLVAQALAELYGSEVALLSQPASLTLDLLGRVQKMQNMPYSTENGATYPDNEFGQGLKQIARLVKAKVGMEVACIDLGGWDTHFFQGTATGLQASNIEQLAKGLAAFDQDLGRMRDRITTLVITEFGRRTYENSSMGTDHGRGFAVMAIGERVHGGQIHGTLPPLNRAHETDLLGPAGLEINYDYRAILAEILTRTLSCKKLDTVFPGFTPTEVGLIKRTVA